MWRRKPSQCRFLQLLRVLFTPDWVWRLTSWRCCFRCIQWRDGSRQGSELDVTGASNLQCRQRTPLNQEQSDVLDLSADRNRQRNPTSENPAQVESVPPQLILFLTYLSGHGGAVVQGDISRISFCLRWVRRLNITVRWIIPLKFFRGFIIEGCFNLSSGDTPSREAPEDLESSTDFGSVAVEIDRRTTARSRGTQTIRDHSYLTFLSGTRGSTALNP